MHEVGDQPVGGERQRKAPLIVGVGASPGSLGSIARFFAKLTVGTDLTIVLTLGHHEAFDEVREAVRKANGGKIAEIADGHAIEGGTIYLCPPAMITTIRNGRFAVRKAEQSPGERAIIDSFLVVVFGGVGNLWGTLVGALSIGVANKLLEPWAGAVLGKIVLLVAIILFIQKKPRGLFALKGRAVEA